MNHSRTAEACRTMSSHVFNNNDRLSGITRNGSPTNYNMPTSSLRVFTRFDPERI